VVADPLTLRTLPPVELVGGMAEGIKHGAIADAAYFDWIDESANALLAGDEELLAALVHGSVFIKAGFVAVDLHENGARAALNFGHTSATRSSARPTTGFITVTRSRSGWC
jgi:3-dehydroquinate synthase